MNFVILVLHNIRLQLIVVIDLIVLNDILLLLIVVLVRFVQLDILLLLIVALDYIVLFDNQWRLNYYLDWFVLLGILLQQLVDFVDILHNILLLHNHIVDCYILHNIQLLLNMFQSTDFFLHQNQLIWNVFLFHLHNILSQLHLNMVMHFLHDNQ